MTSKTIDIETVITVNLDDLWKALWGSDGSGIRYWCDCTATPDGGYPSIWMENLDPVPSTLAYHDCEECVSDYSDDLPTNHMDKPCWHTVSIESLARAYVTLKTKGQTHCGNYPLDIDDSDECLQDLVLQYAIFNDIVYG